VCCADCSRHCNTDLSSLPGYTHEGPVEASHITHRNGREDTFGREDHGLRPEPDFAGVNLFIAAKAVAAVDVRFGLDEKFEAGRKG
jgi:hypothetical protein